MKTNLIILCSLALICSCNKKPKPATVKEKQLNISILLDLSDRIVQPMTPNQTDRDIAIVGNLVDVFKSNMEKKGAYKSKDKIRILFTPAPQDPNINNMAQKLTVDLSKLDNKQKKEKFDKIKTDFSGTLSYMYQQTIKSQNWIGSDIWRFFHYDAKELCIEKDSNYKNILVIVTDGYLYHKQSIDRIKNRTAYVTPSFLQTEGLRSPINWKSKFEKGDYGFIYSGQTFKDLDILVLEINPSSNSKNDEDVIRAYLNKWFTEMKINHFEIYNTDNSVNTKNRIERFF